MIKKSILIIILLIFTVIVESLPYNNEFIIPIEYNYWEVKNHIIPWRLTKEGEIWCKGFTTKEQLINYIKELK